jgi:hypothetical protein
VERLVVKWRTDRNGDVHGAAGAFAHAL